MNTPGDGAERDSSKGGESAAGAPGRPGSRSAGGGGREAGLAAGWGGFQTVVAEGARPDSSQVMKASSRYAYDVRGRQRPLGQIVRIEHVLLIPCFGCCGRQAQQNSCSVLGCWHRSKRRVLLRSWCCVGVGLLPSALRLNANVSSFLRARVYCCCFKPFSKKSKPCVYC